MASKRSAERDGGRPSIRVHGAREHNLKDLSVRIPRERFTVITGVSGSGKSTLAFDILFAEGQRRFLDSMNAYSRQFIDQLPRPDVDLVSGLPPTVSIEQRHSRGGGKSTVGTVTEIHHFLRLLFARIGSRYCPECDLPVRPQTRQQLLLGLAREVRRRGPLLLLSPVVRRRKGFHSQVAAWAFARGFERVRADGKMRATDRPFRLDRFREHDIDVVVGELGQGSPMGFEARWHDRLIEQALEVGRGTLFALDRQGSQSVHSTERVCPRCARSFAPLDPGHFSYHSAQGWCPTCRGFGEVFDLPDVDRGARADAIEDSWFRWREGEREPCPDCHGARLNRLARAVRLEGGDGRGAARSSQTRGRRGPRSVLIEDLGRMSVERARVFFAALEFAGRKGEIARDILPEIRERLEFLREVGLGYLELARSVPSLSGGENQRIRLAAQLGSNLSGVLYVLDEPTIGLHARDNERLLSALERLRSRGNTLVVVEHDEETMRHADYIVDLGPGAGVRGGELVASGTIRQLLRRRDSVTGQSLRARKTVPSRGSWRPVQRSRRPPKPEQDLDKRGRERARGRTPTPWMTLHDVRVHNLKGLTVGFPLNRLIAVSGVSGSGKSTLVGDCLVPAVRDALRQGAKGGWFSSCLSGFEPLGQVYEVDSSPIGRTPRSIPATYVGFWDEVRQLFARVPEARVRGYGPGRFSFNSRLGRCPECLGAGVVKMEMSFLPTAYARCEACGGSRFKPEILEITYGGKHIADVLDLSVREAIEFFAAIPKIAAPLSVLQETGLDYLKLGQTSPTLSGGEAQRLKLVTHLLSGFRSGVAAAGRMRKPSLFILEEPTIGLHARDVSRLLDVLQTLVDRGHTVIVVEHHLEVIAEADWVIDLGPEGGDAGGRVVVAGPPKRVAGHPRSHTGRFLREQLGLFA